MADLKKVSRSKTTKQMLAALAVLAAKAKAAYNDLDDDDFFETIEAPKKVSHHTKGILIESTLQIIASYNNPDDSEDDLLDTIEVSLPKTTKRRAPQKSYPRGSTKKARRAVDVFVQPTSHPEQRIVPTNLPYQDRTPKLCENCTEDTMTWTERCQLERNNYKKNKCNICGTVCSNRRDRFRHEIVRHPWVQFECGRCEDIFDTQRTL